MKKQVRLVLSAVLALSLVGAFALFGCSNNTTTTEKKDDTAKTEQAEPVLEREMKDSFNAGFADARRLYPACGDGTRRAQGAAAVRGRELAFGLSQAKYRVMTVLPPEGAQDVTAEPAPR